MVTIVTDREVEQLSPTSAIAAMRAAVLAAHCSELVAPPRAALELAGGRLMVTAGGTDRWHGYRTCLAGAPADQVVVLIEDGQLRAVRPGSGPAGRSTGAATIGTAPGLDSVLNLSRLSRHGA